jgi:hypothetical protein
VQCRATTDLAKFANQSYLDKAAKRFKLGEMHGKMHRSTRSCSACNPCSACSVVFCTQAMFESIAC